MINTTMEQLLSLSQTHESFIETFNTTESLGSIIHARLKNGDRPISMCVD